MRVAALGALVLVVAACGGNVTGGWGHDAATPPPYWAQLTATSAAFEGDIAPVLTALRALSREIASVEAHPSAQGLLEATRPAQAVLDQAGTEIGAIAWVTSYRVEVIPVLDAASNVQRVLGEADVSAANLAPWVAHLSALSDRLNQSISALRSVLPGPHP